MSRARRKPAATANDNLAADVVDTAHAAILERSHELMERIAFEVAKGVVVALQDVFGGQEPQRARSPEESAPTPTTDVMTADEVAVFLGVDRNTVYDFAGQGVIPHQRLGKRLLFRRGALVSWLDASLCRATSTRKG